jgi:diphthamide synthase (EF-2-diphthine--ammonia ligase)
VGNDEDGYVKKKVLLSWSSGKDSAWSLQVLRQDPDIDVVGLLSTINQHFGRVAMHGTRIELVRAQAKAAGLPLWEIPLPWPCSNAEYERAMAGACERAVADGITAMAFGDLFLEDVRRYRVEKLQGTGLEPISLMATGHSNAAPANARRGAESSDRVR